MIIPYVARGSTQERENPLWHCAPKKKSIHWWAVSYIISLRHKKESIRYDTAIERNIERIHYFAVTQEGGHPLWSCATKKRVSIMSLCHKTEVIHYHAVSQGEYPVPRCTTNRRVSIMLL